MSEYEPRPLKDALASPEDIEKAEDRQPDQIEDYHEKNPTLGKGAAKSVAVDPPEEPKIPTTDDPEEPLDD